MRVPLLLALALFTTNVLALAIVPNLNHQAPFITLTHEQQIPQCKARGLDGKIVLITANYCSKCKTTIPIITKLIKKLRLTKQYQQLDGTVAKDYQQLQQYRLQPQYVPTLIVNCHAYIGAKSTVEYKKLLQGIKKPESK